MLRPHKDGNLDVSALITSCYMLILLLNTVRKSLFWSLKCNLCRVISHLQQEPLPYFEGASNDPCSDPAARPQPADRGSLDRHHRGDQRLHRLADIFARLSL